MSAGREDGQAAVELVAVLPLAVAVVLAVVQLLAAGGARESAAAAAEAGAAAILQDGDPAGAARQALGPAGTARATIAVSGRHVRVTVRPAAPVRAIAHLLEQSAVADAGPGPPVSSGLRIVRGGDGAASRPHVDR